MVKSTPTPIPLNDYTCRETSYQAVEERECKVYSLNGLNVVELADQKFTDFISPADNGVIKTGDLVRASIGYTVVKSVTAGACTWEGTELVLDGDCEVTVTVVDGNKDGNWSESVQIDTAETQEEIKQAIVEFDTVTKQIEDWITNTIASIPNMNDDNIFWFKYDSLPSHQKIFFNLFSTLRATRNANPSDTSNKHNLVFRAYEVFDENRQTGNAVVNHRPHSNDLKIYNYMVANHISSSTLKEVVEYKSILTKIHNYDLRLEALELAKLVLDHHQLVINGYDSNPFSDIIEGAFNITYKNKLVYEYLAGSKKLTLENIDKIKNRLIHINGGKKTYLTRMSNSWTQACAVRNQSKWRKCLTWWNLRVNNKF